MRNSAVLFASLFGLALAGNGRSAVDAAPPAIVFILADDLGWRGLRCYGNELVDTP